MPGLPVSLGCVVILSPGAAGPPDVGTIVAVLQATATGSGQLLATAGSICLMTNSVSGVPYPLPIGSVGVSTGVTVDGQGLVRIGDMIPSGPGILQIIGPPAAVFINDQSPP